MQIQEKLAKLIPHWKQHNREHADGYRKWAEHAAQAGHKRLADLLQQLYHESIKLERLFEEAEKEVIRADSNS